MPSDSGHIPGRGTAHGLDRSLERARYWIIAGFFVGLVALGLVLHGDYGVGWDENNNTQYGRVTLDYVLGRNLQSEYFREPGHYWHPVSGQFARTHGPVVELLLVALGEALGYEDSARQFRMRHICIFLFFVLGALLVFLLGWRALGSWRWGLLGTALLVLSPRLFAHAFHNSMDIPFFALFTLATYSMVRYLERVTPLTAALHGVACALLIDVRIVGLIVPAITGAFLLVEVLAAPARRVRLGRAALSFVVYLLVLCPLVVLMWPMLWGDPVGNLITSFEVSASDPWSWWEHYFGEEVFGTQVPWHFTPVWIAITTPPLYTLCFGVGLMLLLGAARRGLWGGGRRLRQFYVDHRVLLVAICCSVLPLTVVAVLGSTLFNGWRHFYFVYPGFLLLALLGLRGVLRLAGRLRPVAGRVIRVAVALVLLASGLVTAGFMVRSHPHQLCYFNQLVGGPAGARGRFQMGYWGSEYREGLEYLLRKHPKKGHKIVVYISENPMTLLPLLFNSMILSPTQRSRFHFTNNLHEANYFLTNHCSHVPQYKFIKLWSRKVDGAEILSLYRTR